MDFIKNGGREPYRVKLPSNELVDEVEKDIGDAGDVMGGRTFSEADLLIDRLEQATVAECSFTADDLIECCTDKDIFLSIDDLPAPIQNPDDPPTVRLPVFAPNRK